MVQNINQFAQLPVAGEMDMEFLGSVISGAISSNQSTALIASQAVKLDTAIGSGSPKFLALTSNLDTIYGFLPRNLKDQQFVTNQAVECALENSVMFMTANAAITRGAPVEYDYVTNTVITSAGVNPICGYAYDAAVNVGDLIRVWIKPAAYTSGLAAVRTVEVTATLAQINTGTVLIPGSAGKQIRVTNFVEKVTGAFAAGTSVALQSDLTSVVVETTAEAGLTNGAILLPTSANVTLGAGFGSKLPAGEGLKVVNNGAAQTTGTSITYTIQYIQA